MKIKEYVVTLKLATYSKKNADEFIESMIDSFEDHLLDLKDDGELTPDWTAAIKVAMKARLVSEKALSSELVKKEYHFDIDEDGLILFDKKA